MGIDSPAKITVTDRDAAAASKKSILEELKKAFPLDTGIAPPVEDADETVQNTDTPENEQAVQAEPVGEAFVLDAISKILKRLEALEDLNLEERLAKYNTRAPFKI